MLGILTLLSALTISAVAIYYSVAGLVAIFAAAALPIIIMGGALEVGKLVTAVWLHKYWSKATWWLKTYLTTAVIILMFITSMGIFGFLSKAHIEQTTASEESVAQVQRLDTEIGRLTGIVARAEQKIKDLETTGTGGQANIQSQIDIEQDRIDQAYKRAEPLIAEQNKIIENVVGLYETQIEALDNDFNQIQAWINEGGRENIKKVQGMVGTSPDGSWGFMTSNAVDNWRTENRAKREELVNKVQDLSNNPTVVAARKKIEEIRANVEKQVAASNTLINNLRDRLTSQSSNNDVGALIDEQYTKIREANNEIDTLTEEKYALEAEYRKLEAEVGPIKYIAEFIYGDQADKNMLEEAVRWVIIVIIFVFDPLAVLLLIASQYTFHWNRKEKPDDLPVEETDPDADATVGNMVPENIVPLDDVPIESMEQDQIQPDGPRGQVEPVLSKKKTDQYLLWPEIDPDVDQPIPQEYAEEEKISQPPKDPNQLEFDFDFYEKQDDETEEQYLKRIWKKENPGMTIELMKKLKDQGLIDELPWNKIDETITDMKEKGEWPSQASKESQDSVSEQLEKIDDLDAWNSWVEKANEEAEKNPETFEQNSEQNETSTWAKINQARQKKLDTEKLKELEITEEQYRDASQKHIISLIERLKKGLINVDELTETEAKRITQLLEKR